MPKVEAKSESLADVNMIESSQNRDGLIKVEGRNFKSAATNQPSTMTQVERLRFSDQLWTHNARLVGTGAEDSVAKVMTIADRYRIHDQLGK